MPGQKPDRISFSLDSLRFTKRQHIQAMFPGAAGDVHYHIGAGPGDIRDIGDDIFDEHIEVTGGAEHENPDDIKIAGAPAKIINIGAFNQELFYFFGGADFHLNAHDAHKIEPKSFRVGDGAYFHGAAAHQAFNPVAYRSFRYFKFPADFPEALPRILLKFFDYLLSKFIQHVIPPNNPNETIIDIIRIFIKKCKYYFYMRKEFREKGGLYPLMRTAI
jgi:hypothetical protein